MLHINVIAATAPPSAGGRRLAMASEVVQDNSGGDERPQISNSAAANVAEEVEELKLLQDAVYALPTHAVKDFFSLGVC